MRGESNGAAMRASTRSTLHPWALRNPRDRRAVATVGVALVLLLLPQFVSPGAWALLWIGVATVACCSSHVVVHNHCHRPLFRTVSANRTFNLFATIARGHCASDVYLAHNVNHHAEQGGSGDWITPALGGCGHPLLRLSRFVVRAAVSMVRERNRLPHRGRDLVPEPFRSSLPWEKRFLPLVILLLLWNDWQAACLYALTPWALSLVWLVGVNFVQHDGCDPHTEWAHSRNFSGRFANWLLFNNGYHTAHHVDPGLHWSGTKSLHERLASRIPSRLQQPSAAQYMIRRYLLGQDD